MVEGERRPRPLLKSGTTTSLLWYGVYEEISYVLEDIVQDEREAPWVSRKCPSR